MGRRNISLWAISRLHVTREYPEFTAFAFVLLSWEVLMLIIVAEKYFACCLIKLVHL